MNKNEIIIKILDLAVKFYNEETPNRMKREGITVILNHIVVDNDIIEDYTYDFAGFYKDFLSYWDNIGELDELLKQLNIFYPQK